MPIIEAVPAVANTSSNPRRERRDLLALTALACGGLILFAIISIPFWHDIALGHTDFLSFYAGGRLAFTPVLYDKDQAMAEQLRAAQVMGKGSYYTRMPWFAGLMWPLARLPYIPAQFIWQGLLIGGLVLFAGLWPRPSLAVRITFLCYSLPALISLRMAQDLPLLLACMAVSLLLLNRDKPVLAGLILSLTLAKFHLFLPLFPAVLFARRWKLAAGLYGGAAVLLASNFLVGGLDWPRQYLAAIFDPAVTPGVIITPSLYYLIPSGPIPHVIPVAAIAIVLMIFYLALARQSDEFLIAAAPLAILPILPHAGSYDCLLLTPLAFNVLVTGSRAAKAAAILLLIPITYFVAWSVPALPILIPILMIALLAATALPVLKKSLPDHGETRIGGPKSNTAPARLSV